MELLSKLSLNIFKKLRYDVRQEFVNKNYQENVIQVPLNTLETVELLHWEISTTSTELVNLPPVQCDTGKGGCDDKLPECEIENEIKRPPCPPKPPNTRVCPKDLLIKKKKNIKPNEKT
ncbi:hypothetical protein RN001_010876 [Aquatica leii]|uniref:Uncharacterized protein n=1 Tax=Aquatica leii TaxID=1421715 RepID=A0AAN7SQJ0_9COLE|nr:hypothetical protein RN001_010876 [Aquatica leii]